MKEGFILEAITKKVDRLEEIMAELAEQSKITQQEIARLSSEIRAFKDEMKIWI